MTPSRLRLVFFGTGGLLSAASLRAIAAEHDVLAVVRAERGGRMRHLVAQVARQLGLRAADPLTQAALALRVPQWRLSSLRDPDVARRLSALRPDLLCVAHFPWRLTGEVLGAAAHGGMNLHTSLLPRHRGPLPLFWVYHADDRETGLTVHHMSAEFDRGDIIAQRSFPLTRGYPVDDLNATNARVGPELLREALQTFVRGDASRRTQDDAAATAAPFVKPGTRMVDFEAWDVERVWHFLAGLWPRFVEPLTDTAGQPASYAGVVGYERGVAGAPLGRVQAIAPDRLALQCRGGIVIVRPASDAGR